MGKKGKRSKKEDAKKAADKIIRQSDTILQGAFKDYKDHMFSKFADKMRVAIRLLESKDELLLYTRDKILDACYALMILEYQRRDYNAALDCCNYITSRSRQSSSLIRDAALLYYQLLMLRLNGKECQLSEFIHHIPREGDIATEFCFEAILAFRAHKIYDSAIQLEMTCGRLLWNPLESKLSLALTYLEKYRVEYHQRSQMREEDFSTMRSLIMSIQEEYEIERNMSFSYCLVFAQWYYLTHTPGGVKEIRERLINAASKMVEFCLEYTSQLLPYSCPSENKCYTCGQAATPTEVQYVCSGCRVACYCSIDHQRMTWKKEAVKGMHIGHEILCPLYKAHKKYTEARDLKDEEKEARMKRRLKRECRYFLENGLGLKNKCFPERFQDAFKGEQEDNHSGPEIPQREN